MRKLLFICAILLFSAGLLKSQNEIEYSHNDNGNRYYRGVVTLKTPETYNPEINGAISSVSGDVVMTIMPNPTQGQISISASEDMNSIVSVFDFSGRMISETEFRGTTVNIDLSNETPGQYLMIVQTGDKKKEFLIIKE